MFDVKGDGTLANGRVFLDVTAMVKAKKPGLPDGLKIDTDGNLFATGPGGVLIISPAGQASRHDRHGAGDLERRVRRRRAHALHDG